MNTHRQKILKDVAKQGRAVVYVMSRDQRVTDNHALILAQQAALKLKLPLYVLFVLKTITSRSLEHYMFMLEGLQEVSRELSGLNISFNLRIGKPSEQILLFLNEVQAQSVFFDFSPLRRAQSVVAKVTKEYEAHIQLIDTHNIIPVWITSDKQEFAAHTIRRKIHKLLPQYLVSPEELIRHPFRFEAVKNKSFAEATKYVSENSRIPRSHIHLHLKSGSNAALEQLNQFIQNDLKTYAHSRNNIAEDSQSGLSPYLHFGQISSLRVALEVLKIIKAPPLLFQKPKMPEAPVQQTEKSGMNALFEEMIVRKELADNFCFYNEHYDSIKGVPAWAKTSLNKHSKDPREFLYTKTQLEHATTHDTTWNAAQTELLRSGKIHGYMRMYWAKKILEWSEDPETAIKTAAYLNDKYSIDGGDPNGYVGILWSIGGLHDRPWFERSVYGKVRYMNEAGLRRKFSVNDYIARVKI